MSRNASVVTGLGLAALLCAALFMTLGANNNWDFILPFRGAKVATLVLVGFAIAVSSVLFQTATGNRILTPAIMGFDSLYLLIQTALIFSLGSGLMSRSQPLMMFGIEVVLMLVFSGILHIWLFSSLGRSLHLMVLVGVVLGVMFRSLSAFLQRMIDPNEFAYLSDRFFASFNNPDKNLLLISAALVIGVSALGWRYVRAFDVLTLGRDAAIGLGVDHKRTVSVILIIVAVLVSVSTALVGPVTFFGLLVANLTYALLPTYRHALLLPASAFVAIIALIGGQVLLEQVFKFGTNLRVIIEFLGGITFILMLMRGRVR